MGSGYFPDRHVSSFFGQNVDFQPARDCPRNFIIFDRTDNHSRVMYHPDTAPLVQKDENAPGVMNDDLADIDALLSFEDEEEDEGYDEDVDDDVSTGRTGGHGGGDTSDSCCSSSVMRNGGPGVLLSGEGLRDGEIRKRDKMKKMVKSLKGIVPGVNGGMNTVDVLDEAVKYLKSLKVEAQKMRIGDLNG